MTFSQINCFVTTAKLASFTAAASKLYISQQAVSIQIAGLEKELGFRLLDRRSLSKMIKNGNIKNRKTIGGMHAGY